MAEFRESNSDHSTTGVGAIGWGASHHIHGHAIFKTGQKASQA